MFRSQGPIRNLLMRIRQKVREIIDRIRYRLGR